MTELGGTPVGFDLSPFREAATLLYAGPWVAERLAAIREFAETKPEALYPITARIILGSAGLKATDAFLAMYRLAEIARQTEGEWQRFGFDGAADGGGGVHA